MERIFSILGKVIRERLWAKIMLVYISFRRMDYGMAYISNMFTDTTTRESSKSGSGIEYKWERQPRLEKGLKKPGHRPKHKQNSQFTFPVFLQVLHLPLVDFFILFLGDI